MVNENKTTEVGIHGTFTTESAKATEDQQWVKYKNQKTGHGFSAEDANAINDKLKGKKVNKVGLSNEKDGADRIVTDRHGNTQYIQTKYYDTAENTVNSAFDKKTGIFRYKGQVIEVPKDQYEDAIKEMVKKIQEGKVPGTNVKDAENEARKIIKRGDVTYRQARNIAKPGNIDSLVFDIKTQCVVSSCAFGISFVVQYASCIINGMEPKDALKFSVMAGLKSGSLVLGVGVFTQQFLRTSIGRGFAAFTSSISKRIIDQVYSTEVGKKVIHKLATALLGKQIFGAAAKNYLTKLLRTNIVTAIITGVAMSIPDFWKALVSKKISWKQFAKNVGITAVGIGGGLAGAWGGALAGAAAGTVIPVIGNIAGAVGGFLGGLGVSIGSAILAKKIFDKITPDDAKVMFELAQEAIAQLAIDYLITEEEFEKDIVGKIEKTITPKWLENMYQAGAQVSIKRTVRFNFAYEKMEPFFEECIQVRKKIILPSKWRIRNMFRKAYFIMFIEYLKEKIGSILGKKETTIA